MDDHRLTPERYLECLHAEGERLLAAAEDRWDRDVPPCPGWTVHDVLAHLGSVYRHKVAALRLGRRPEEGEWSRLPDDATGEQASAFCHEALHAIAHELQARDPADPAWTFGADPTVAFWFRRMAQETAVHRVDVQLAGQFPDPVEADLARDGIDELVEVFLPRGGVSAAEAGIAAEDLEPSADVRLSAPGGTVTGSPSDVLLWMWGRLPDAAVRTAGDTAALREALRAGTQ